MHDVLIIGGGIGGLAAAAALQRQGIDAQVFEAAPELRPVGAGIWVPPNAMSVLEHLGVAVEVAETGLPLERLEVRDLEEGVLQGMTGAETAERWGHQTVAIRRSELQRILVSALQPGTLHLNKALQYFEDRGFDVRARFVDGTETRGKFLIGADGLHSAVRRQLFPHVSLRYSGQSCFRGLASVAMPEGMERTAWEVWGGAARFGFSAVDPECVYWFAPFKARAGQQLDPGEASRRLAAQYASFPEPIPAIIAATPPDAIIQTDLYDFAPIRHWHKGNVLLIGDAAHATTPNLGQGGAQALEDALSLALKVEAQGLTPSALAAVEEARRRKASKVVNTSWQFGKIAHWENRFLRRARNFALRSTPARLRERQLDELFTARV